ncbi:MAG: hypothetical protein CMI54_08565 [Parcubacteria group bacterium]|nr:hypothetical protein [Parcubacteria group bacterium]|tara:strand:- start:11237 stop:11521 length:285 start_codon:yes stop_codon:yes gene_type:complete
MGIDDVESLLKALKRPATGSEIVMFLSHVTNKASVYRVLRNLVNQGIVVKVIVHFPFCDAKIPVFVHTSLTINPNSNYKVVFDKKGVFIKFNQS